MSVFTYYVLPINFLRLFPFNLNEQQANHKERKKNMIKFNINTCI